jgi:hypothetical protein
MRSKIFRWIVFGLFVLMAWAILDRFFWTLW